jgi:hypothetical protein
VLSIDARRDAAQLEVLAHLGAGARRPHRLTRGGPGRRTMNTHILF